MKIRITREAERPFARTLNDSRALEQHQARDELELELDGPTTAVPLAGQSKQAAAKREIKAAEQIVHAFLISSATRFANETNASIANGRFRIRKAIDGIETEIDAPAAAELTESHLDAWFGIERAGD